MVDAGVRVFKIEGRARGPEYVAEAVGCYSEALQAITDGTFSEERIAEWDARLVKIFNRGYWNGYYMGYVSGNGAPNMGQAPLAWRRAMQPRQ